MKTDFLIFLFISKGFVGLILRFISPLTIAPAIVMVGLSLFGAAGNMAGKNWGISSLSVACFDDLTAIALK